MRHLLDSEAILLRRVRDGSDTLKRPKYTYTPLGRVDVLRQKGNGREIATEGGRKEIAEWQFFASPDVPITRYDRLTYEGTDYEILAVDPISAPFRGIDHYEIIARVA